MERIIRNRCKCLKCYDIIESVNRHHMIYCKCGEIFTDGGREYIRRGATDLTNIEDLSEFEDT